MLGSWTDINRVIKRLSELPLAVIVSERTMFHWLLHNKQENVSKTLFCQLQQLFLVPLAIFDNNANYRQPTLLLGIAFCDIITQEKFLRQSYFLDTKVKE